MRRFALAVAVLAVVASRAAVAAVPATISFQGRLTSGGAPVNATVSMTVKLYDALTGGTLLWSEPHAAVVVTNGLYNVILGNTTPLNETILAGQVYLTVSVAGDPDMTPRMPLASAPYSIRAIRATALDTTLGVAGGGTGATTLGQGRLLIGQGTGAVSTLPNLPINRILVSGDLTTNPPLWSTFTANAAGLSIPAGAVLYVDGVQVVGSQLPAVANSLNATGVDVASGGPIQVVTVQEYNELVVILNLLLERLRIHGLIAP